MTAAVFRNRSSAFRSTVSITLTANESGRHIYTFENLCLEDHSLHLKDDAVKVFVNTKGTVGDVSEEFSEIKEYKFELVNDLALALSDARSRDEWRKEYMSIEVVRAWIAS